MTRDTSCADGHSSQENYGQPMSLFFRDGDNLVPLAQEGYAVEAVLQELIAKQPQLLPGDEISPDEDSPQFLLVRREAPVGGNSLDHLFLDRNAIPTLVEVKRADNPDVRRKVVGQMLDYAANCASEWDAETLGEWLNDRCTTEGLNAPEVLAGLEHAFDDDEAFFQQAEANIKAGKVRLIFVADSIPQSLQSIVEFLNEQLRLATVLAVEVVQYTGPDGEQLLSSSLIGQTQVAQQVKGKSNRPAVFRALVDGGLVSPGDEVWLRPEALGPAGADVQPNDARLRLIVDGVVSGRPILRYEPAGGDPLLISHSKAPDHVRHAFDPSYTTVRATSVYDKFSLAPGGPTLGEVAIEHGLWDADD